MLPINRPAKWKTNRTTTSFVKIRNCIDIPSDVFKGLFAFGPAAGIIYGLLKIPKTDFHSKFKFRLIFAAIF